MNLSQKKPMGVVANVYNFPPPHCFLSGEEGDSDKADSQVAFFVLFSGRER